MYLLLHIPRSEDDLMLRGFEVVMSRHLILVVVMMLPSVISSGSKVSKEIALVASTAYYWYHVYYMHRYACLQYKGMHACTRPYILVDSMCITLCTLTLRECEDVLIPR